MIVIFDGMDKVGKTTLIHALDKATDYEHIIIDRGPNSYQVYNKIYNRGKGIDLIRTEMDLMNDTCLVVYCCASAEDIQARLSKVDEELPLIQGSIKNVATMFDKAMQESNLNMVTINTSALTIEESVRRIQNAILALKQKDFIKLQTKFIDDNYEEYYPSFNTFDERLLKELPPFNAAVDLPYYMMLDSALTHMMHKHAIGWLNHRQLVYTSNDCISSIQVIQGDTTEIIVNQRSLDLSKQGSNDLAFIFKWARENLDYEKLFIHYNVGVPHRFI